MSDRCWKCGDDVEDDGPICGSCFNNLEFRVEALENKLPKDTKEEQVFKIINERDDWKRCAERLAMVLGNVRHEKGCKPGPCRCIWKQAVEALDEFNKLIKI